MYIDFSIYFQYFNTAILSIDLKWLKYSHIQHLKQTDWIALDLKAIRWGNCDVLYHFFYSSIYLLLLLFIYCNRFGFKFTFILTPNKQYEWPSSCNVRCAHTVSECEPIKLNCTNGNMIRPVFLCFISFFFSFFLSLVLKE